MASPSRLQMPLIHPEKENNGLWFKIDKCLTDDCNMVADEMKFTWWGDFVVRVLCYFSKVLLGPIHDNVVRLHWKKTMMSLISNFISKRKRSGKIPPFMSSEHWVFLIGCPPYKGRVYGLGSAHCYYGDSTPSTSTANSHIHKPWQNRRIRHGQPRPPL
ncbi:hypothetical protein HID58_025889 [Brassica napus]|uniref:Ubiquitin-like protease family profile domain-containing protein n=1 Tax=Brassica napus TaxID=3708 RepID=A0ABQ8CME4_BRANA|nr:hypothetical protein HID58_025889 [Brassica napus]